MIISVSGIFPLNMTEHLFTVGLNSKTGVLLLEKNNQENVFLE